MTFASSTGRRAGGVGRERGHILFEGERPPGSFSSWGDSRGGGFSLLAPSLGPMAFVRCPVLPGIGVRGFQGYDCDYGQIVRGRMRTELFRSSNFARYEDPKDCGPLACSRFVWERAPVGF